MIEPDLIERVRSGEGAEAVEAIARILARECPSKFEADPIIPPYQPTGEARALARKILCAALLALSAKDAAHETS